MRPELRQLLTPRMIQSMEILQLPLQKLEERIEQELQNNPVLELTESDAEDGGPVQVMTEDADGREERSEAERPLLVNEESNQAEDFNRLEKLTEYLENEEFFTNNSREFRTPQSYDGERDKKLDAMTNTAARGEPLAEVLLHQWAFVECSPSVRAAGESIINYIDAEGYLRTDLVEIQKDPSIKIRHTMEDLNDALKLVQTLDPPGIGARTLQECLLLQLDAVEQDPTRAEDHDFELERKLVQEHLKDLEMNRYPQISRKLSRDIAEINFWRQSKNNVTGTVGSCTAASREIRKASR